jgi:hypothetical protein
LNDKVAEGGAEIERLEYKVGVTVRDKRRLKTRAGNTDDGERGQQRTTHQVFPNLVGSKKKCESARILLETQIAITTKLLLVGDEVG